MEVRLGPTVSSSMQRVSLREQSLMMEHQAMILLTAIEECPWEMIDIKGCDEVNDCLTIL